MKLKRIAPLLVLILMVGCAKKIHPGALNAADSSIYDQILVLQSGTEEAKKQVEGCQKEATAGCDVVLKAKPDVNKAIASYNVAADAYQGYHAAGVGDIAALQALVAQAIADSAAMQKAFGKKAVKQ